MVQVGCGQFLRVSGDPFLAAVQIGNCQKQGAVQFVFGAYFVNRFFPESQCDAETFQHKQNPRNREYYIAHFTFAGDHRNYS